MSPDAWLTLGVVLAMVAAIASERISTPTAVFGALGVLLLTGVVDATQAFAGFANTAPITVAVLYVLARAVEMTGALTPVVTATLGKGRTAVAEMARTTVPAAAASAFLNNTPIVTVLAPQITAWARRTGRAASTYLMPMCFAVTLGGLITLIGTSSNLVVSGFLEKAGEDGIEMFEITRVGLPIAVAGVLLLILLAPVALPKRKAALETLSARAREFTVEMTVVAGGPMERRTVAAAGLRNLQGVFLAQIDRGERRIAPVGPDELLAAGDRLTFVGNVSRVLDLQAMSGLSFAQPRGLALDGARRGPGPRFYEAVVGPSSGLVGTTLKSSDFRARFDAVVVAIHRPRHQLDGKLGEIPLKVGDVLLVLSSAAFREQWGDRDEFLVVSPVEGVTPLRQRKAALVGIVALGVIVVAGAGVMPILNAAILGALALVGLGVMSPHEARASIDIGVVAVIAASFGIGAAMTESGLADEVARLLVSGLGRFGDVGTLAGVFVATVLLHQIITNSATVALMFPIAAATAARAGLQLRPFAMVVAIGAASAFMTPIGYQTNMIVHSLGGYRLRDFARIGLPLTVVVSVVTLLVVPIAWPLR